MSMVKDACVVYVNAVAYRFTVLHCPGHVDEELQEGEIKDILLSTGRKKKNQIKLNDTFSESR